MARAKYKLGTLVEYKIEGGTSDVGLVEGVMSTRDGYQYQVKGMPGFVEESSVLAAYRPILSRTKRKVSKPKPVVAPMEQHTTQ